MENRAKIEVVDEAAEEMLLQASYIADEEVEDILYDIEKTRVHMRFLKDHEDKCKAHLKEFVKEASLITNHKGYMLATWNASQTTSFDTERFKKDYPELYEAYLKHSEKRTLIIKARPIE
jgi:predicted phage-related endonuclease